jgi:autotransporter-associated beta strand protein
VANGYTPPAGFTPGSYRLVKSGLGTLTLSADNAYSGGTALKAGRLDLAAVAAAGTGPVIFLGHATLKIENASLSGHVVFVNEIAFFARSDTLDLSGLRFHAGAKAKYHPATGVLTVHSGHVTDIFTLLSPHGTRFTVANDGTWRNRGHARPAPPHGGCGIPVHARCYRTGLGHPHRGQRQPHRRLSIRGIDRQARRDEGFLA